MKTQKCKICGTGVGLMGWAKHVAMEKRLFGQDCYEKVKIPLTKKDKSLLDYALRQQGGDKNEY